MAVRSLLRFLRRWLKRLFLLCLILCLIALIAAGVVFREALHHQFVHYPRMEAAWTELRTQRQEVTLDDGWTEFRGICHTHSHLSHDSTVPFETILDAAHEAALDFVMLTDHCTDGMGDFSLQWRGIHEDVLFLPGFETSSGFLLWGLPESARIDCNAEPAELTAAVHAQGGMLFFAHTEEERPYELAEVSGMEIYNIHTDIKDEELRAVLGETLLTSRRYSDLSLYSIFDRHPPILARWDAENKLRPFAGISANDAHQNVGVSLRRDDGALLYLDSTSGDPITQFNLGPLAKLLPGPGEIFRLDLDPYARSLRYVNMHVLAQELSEPAILEAVKAGRAYIGFDLIADSSGFVFVAESEASGARATLGEELVLSGKAIIRAESPLPCRFRLFHDGEQVAEQEGRTFQHEEHTPGNYRMEAELRVLETWAPWVMTNPIRLRAASQAGSTTAAEGV